MNLILLEPSEFDGHDRVRLLASDRRARHLREVLRVVPGQSLRIGVRDGQLGTASVAAAGDDFVLHCRLEQPAPPAEDILILAIPRPKVLLRCVETAAALGFGKILLVRTWRTDRSHVEASALRGEELDLHLRLGLEQAERTALPALTQFDRFRPFVEDHLDRVCGSSTRLLATPQASVELAQLPLPNPRRVALAIGPERGFTEFERDALCARGFTACRAGVHALRVETALAYLMGHVAALRMRAQPPERNWCPAADK